MAGRGEETGRGMRVRDNSRVGEREKREGLLAGKSSGKMIALWEGKRMIASRYIEKGKVITLLRRQQAWCL